MWWRRCRVLDAARGRVAVTALVTVRFYDGLSFAENPVSVVVGVGLHGAGACGFGCWVVRVIMVIRWL